jgi:hypothetical protein
MKQIICIFLPILFIACETAENKPAAKTTADPNTTGTTLCRPDAETKADQEAKKAVREAELRKNEKMKKETN